MSADYVEKNIKAFYKLRQAEHRYASFDFCYNYFQSFEDKGQLSRKGNIQMSCLQLGFYLASWGMFRMSGYLGSSKSIKFFEETIFLISRSDNDIIWNIDVNNYDNENMENLIEWYYKLENVLSHQEMGRKSLPTKTLVTKVMLGIFGCVPALDSNFINGMNIYGKFNKNILRRIFEFYSNNETVINKYSSKIKTLDFYPGKNSTLRYPKAKIIDMYGFIEGLK